MPEVGFAFADPLRGGVKRRPYDSQAPGSRAPGPGVEAEELEETREPVRVRVRSAEPENRQGLGILASHVPLIGPPQPLAELRQRQILLGVPRASLLAGGFDGGRPPGSSREGASCRLGGGGS